MYDQSDFELSVGLSFVYRTAAAVIGLLILFWDEPDLHGALVALLMSFT